MIKNFILKGIDTRISILTLTVIGLLTILIAGQVYNYEIELSRQDSRYYILLAENFNNYFVLDQQVAMRVLPSFLARIVGNTFSLNIYYSFKVLTYFFFFILLFKTFFFFKKFNSPDYLALSSVLIIYFSNNSVIYTIFNSYQLVDLLLYLFSIMIIEAAIFDKKKQLFIFSFLAIFTKEFLIMLIISGYLINYFNTKDKKNIIYFISILIIFFTHYYFAGSLNLKDPNISKIIINDIGLFKNYFREAYLCLIQDRNYFFFFPFLFLILSVDFLKLIKKYFFLFLYMLIPVLISIFLYNHIGENFFRVYYQGFFIFVLFSLIFIIKKTSNHYYLSLAFFLLPLSFLIDFVFIFLNINQDGFTKYYQVTRYEYFSGYFLFCLIFIIILLKIKKIKHQS